LVDDRKYDLVQLYVEKELRRDGGEYFGKICENSWFV